MAAESMNPEVEKKIRAINKKLKQISVLKEKPEDQLDDAAREKIASEAGLKKELKALQTGAPPPAAEPAPAAKPEPVAEPEVVEEAPAPEPELSPEEKEKKIKGLKKKLQQIERLKEKGTDNLDPEAKAKVASEPSLLAEIAKLEGRVPEAPKPQKNNGGYSAAPAAPAAPVAAGKDPYAAQRAKALEALDTDLILVLEDEDEKKIKALQKKLRDIGKLHEKDHLDKLQQEKIAAEPSLLRELSDIKTKAQAQLLSKRQARAA
eukprot:gb/GFBE01018784.1/.p1 GENE.gb/GFBE01018784.1/~~gb/GFBE01018784.1/.p1  ORF type:complete len:263 (+),score=107.27 gb/GFBE01018784.1/:1-789(+)